MAPKRFRLSRLALIMNDPTRAIEVIIALCNVIVPGVAFLFGTTRLPVATQELLGTVIYNEHFIGFFAIVLGGLQIWGAGTDWHDARGFIATTIFCLLIALISAYWWTGYDSRPTMYLMAGTVIAEMFIAWRCYHEKPESVSKARPHHVPIQ